jgi:O-antigen/teichoic acid export membrane protein
MRARLQTLRNSPLLVNGYSLASSTWITSGLGLVYWLIAAHLYTVEEIGINSTLISTMGIISTLAQLNLGSLLARFLPNVGRSAARWVLAAYAITTLASVLFCLLLFVGIRAWIPSLRFLIEDYRIAGWFVLASIPWAIFALNDWVLAGLRKAAWVPLGTTIFAVMKIALLALFVSTSLQALGPFASWAISAAAVMFVVVGLIFARLLRGHSPVVARVDLRVVLRYISGDFIGTMLFLAAIGVGSIIVMERIGPEGAAKFNLAWTVAYPLWLASMAMGTSLLAEGAANHTGLREMAYRALIYTMALVGCGAVVVIAAAPMILRLFGSYYAGGGTLLRLVALSSLPYGFIAVSLAVARVEGRMGVVVATQAAMLVAVVGLGVPLLDKYGVLGMGIAWLVTVSLLALILAVGWAVRSTHLSRLEV